MGKRKRFNFSFFDFAVLSDVAVYVSCLGPSSGHCDGNGATAAAFGKIPVVATTNGVFVLVRICACWWGNPNHNLDDYSSHPLEFKTSVQFSAISTAKNSSTSNEPYLGSHFEVYVSYVGRIPCVPPLQSATPPPFQVNHIPKGTLY